MGVIYVPRHGESTEREGWREGGGSLSFLKIEEDGFSQVSASQEGLNNSPELAEGRVSKPSANHAKLPRLTRTAPHSLCMGYCSGSFVSFPVFFFPFFSFLMLILSCALSEAKHRPWRTGGWESWLQFATIVCSHVGCGLFLGSWYLVDSRR